MPHKSPENAVLEAKRLIESNNRSEIRLNANGGNSVLLVCDPLEEAAYIKAAHELLPEEGYSIIDLNKILIRFVEEHKNDLDDYFDLLKGSVNQIFKAPRGESGPDLFQLILSAVSKSYQEGKIPVLIHTGALYGSEIENIHIMEDEVVMRSGLPLLILYPAVKDGDMLLFLGRRPSSKYRCMIIE